MVSDIKPYSILNGNIKMQGRFLQKALLLLLKLQKKKWSKIKVTKYANKLKLSCMKRPTYILNSLHKTHMEHFYFIAPSTGHVFIFVLFLCGQFYFKHFKTLARNEKYTNLNECVKSWNILHQFFDQISAHNISFIHIERNGHFYNIISLYWQPLRRKNDHYLRPVCFKLVVKYLCL